MFLKFPFKPNFNSPKDSQYCVRQSIQASSCLTDTRADLNTCIYTNRGDFVVYLARCTRIQDKENSIAVFDGLSEAYAMLHTPLTVKKDEFVFQANWASIGASVNNSSLNRSTNIWHIVSSCIRRNLDSFTI